MNEVVTAVVENASDPWIRWGSIIVALAGVLAALYPKIRELNIKADAALLANYGQQIADIRTELREERERAAAMRREWEDDIRREREVNSMLRTENEQIRIRYEARIDALQEGHEKRVVEMQRALETLQREVQVMRQNDRSRQAGEVTVLGADAAPSTFAMIERLKLVPGSGEPPVDPPAAA